VAAAIGAADADQLVATLRSHDSATVEVDGESVTVTSDDVIVSETPRTGWAVASGNAETVALDLELDAELRAAGMVRELIRAVQEARKSIGLEVTDRIELFWTAEDAVAAALTAGAPLLAEEVLAVAITPGAPAAALVEHELAEIGIRFWLRPVG
jgi:isoleucyl-tRNA synthetase